MLKELKKVCKNGHELTAENTAYHGKQKKRRCKVCVRERAAKHYRQNRDACTARNKEWRHKTGRCATRVLQPVAERFWEKVDKTPGLGPQGKCWQWKAGLFNMGYGQFWAVNDNGKNGNVLAHRFSYELANGPIEGKLFVCHRCDNFLCVNPDHLFLGTQADNMRDRFEKGRFRVHKPYVPITHCVHGHEYTDENTVSNGRGRTCRICAKARQKRRQPAANARRRELRALCRKEVLTSKAA